jgi:hypothetical protein
VGRGAHSRQLAGKASVGADGLDFAVGFALGGDILLCESHALLPSPEGVPNTCVHGPLVPDISTYGHRQGWRVSLYDGERGKEADRASARHWTDEVSLREYRSANWHGQQYDK